jgi:hypothetical protein
MEGAMMARGIGDDSDAGLRKAVTATSVDDRSIYYN